MEAAVRKPKETEKAATSTAKASPEEQTEEELENGAAAGVPLFLHPGGKTGAAPPPASRPHVQSTSSARQQAQVEERERQETIQTRRGVGQSGDTAQRETDTVAEQVATETPTSNLSGVPAAGSEAPELQQEQQEEDLQVPPLQQQEETEATQATEEIPVTDGDAAVPPVAEPEARSPEAVPESTAETPPGTPVVEPQAREKAAENKEAAAEVQTEEAAKVEQEQQAEAESAEKAAVQPAVKGEAGVGQAPGEAATAEAETGAAAAAVEAGPTEAGSGVQAPAAATEGGAAGGGGAVAGEAGGEPQGGSEDEGAAELEERLARADPERAVADEADPADVARGEPIEAEGEESETLPEPPEPGAETPAASATPEADTETNAPTAPAVESVTSADTRAETATEERATAAESEEAATTEEEPASAEGFSGDEPALGSGALERSPTVPELSEPEKQAAMDSLGESAGGGESGGGGGGGAAVPEKAPPEAPDVSAQEPGAALATVGSLPPVQLKQALGGVNAAVGKSAGDKRAELAASPPSMARPTGSPRNLHGRGTAGSESAGEKANKVEQAPEGRDKPIPQPEALPEPPPSPAESVREPAVTGGEGGKLSESDVSRMSDSMASMPTRDPGLHATAGPAPKVELSDNADPAQTDQQQARLHASVTETQAQGRADVAQEMGENTKLYPSVPPEELTAQVPQGGGQEPSAAVAGGAAGGDADPEALSIIAQKEKGGEIQTALAQAQGDLTAKKAEYGSKVGEEKARSAEEISALEAQSAADQAQARAETQAEVRGKKGEWSKEQEKTVREANKEADGEVAKGRKDIQQKKQDADSEASEHVRKGNQEAERERLKAEQKAAAEKRKGKKKSKGFFGWLASKAKAVFNAIKSAVKAAFDFARKLIKKAIEAAKKAAMWAIEQARKAIVAAIKVVGKALIAIGDRLLAAFPRLRDRFRKFIQNKVDAAVKKVNEYADKLKKGVSALLDALAAGLDKLVGWLEKGMLAVIDAYAAVVDGAIKFAEKVAQALGAFVVLIKDIAAGPGQWLRNLASGVVDGIKNHLWKAFKQAVQGWFNSKLEQVLGLGTMVWGLIKSGGLSLAKVGKMAWEGIKAMIPPTLTRILVEKLAAMIVPAAGAVMVIIEGLQAAWGAVQRIIAAFQKFFAFLKSVKTGKPGPSFAAALAAAAIAVIDFVANWLIAKLAKGAAKLGGKIKALARKILGRKKGKAKGKKAKAKAGQGMKPKPKKPAKKPSRPPKPKKPRKSAQDKKRDKRKEKERKKRDRLEKAVQAIKPKLHVLLAKGIGKITLKARLLLWRARYRLSKLTLQGSGNNVGVVATVNPTADVLRGIIQKHGAPVVRMIRELGRKLLRRPEVREKLRRITEQRAEGKGRDTDQPLIHEPGAGFPAQAADVARFKNVPSAQAPKGAVRQPWTQEHMEVGGVPVREWQTYTSGAGHIRTTGVGTYDAIASDWAQMRKGTGATDADIATAMRVYRQTGALDSRFQKYSGTIASLTRLTAVEMGRSSGHVVTGTMAMELMESGKVTGEQAFREQNPMAPSGAVRSAAAVSEQVGLPPEREYKSPASRTKVDQMINTELQLMTNYLYSKMQIEKPLFRNAEQLERFIQRELRDYLEDRLHSTLFLG